MEKRETGFASKRCARSPGIARGVLGTRLLCPSHRVDSRSETESFGMRCTAGIDLLIRRWRSAVHGVVQRGLRATSSNRPPREEAQVLSQCEPGWRQLTRL